MLQDWLMERNRAEALQWMLQRIRSSGKVYGYDCGSDFTDGNASAPGAYHAEPCARLWIRSTDPGGSPERQRGLPCSNFTSDDTTGYLDFTWGCYACDKKLHLRSDFHGIWEQRYSKPHTIHLMTILRDLYSMTEIKRVSKRGRLSWLPINYLAVQMRVELRK